MKKRHVKAMPPFVAIVFVNKLITPIDKRIMNVSAIPIGT